MMMMMKFKTCVNVPHVNKMVTDVGGIYTNIPAVATPLTECWLVVDTGQLIRRTSTS